MDVTSQNVDYYVRCNCGAIGLNIAGQTYYVAKQNLKKFFPMVDLRGCVRVGKTNYCCDYCVNHYGVDLCACGSGEHYNHCKNGFSVCGKPMQKVGSYGCVTAADCWGSGGEVAYEFYH